MSYIEPKIYYQNLPQKRMAVAALIFNEQGQILILKTSYKKYWLLPGGVVEKDESLAMALTREIKEEIDLDITNFKLAALDYCAPNIRNGVQNTESLQILFDCGQIDPVTEALIIADGDEVLEYKFCDVEETLKLLSKPLRKRVSSYLDGRETAYLENGLKIC
jgi:ADP-ribose pyrophosphatase YjhB (NUDIX family)